MREILTQESNESEFFKCAGYNRKIYQSLHEKWKTKYWFERIYMYFSNKYQSSKALKFNRQWSKALEIIRQSSKSKKKINRQPSKLPRSYLKYLLQEPLFHEFNLERGLLCKSKASWKALKIFNRGLGQYYVYLEVIKVGILVWSQARFKQKEFRCNILQIQDLGWAPWADTKHTYAL